MFLSLPSSLKAMGKKSPWVRIKKREGKFMFNVWLDTAMSSLHDFLLQSSQP